MQSQAELSFTPEIWNPTEILIKYHLTRFIRLGFKPGEIILNKPFL